MLPCRALRSAPKLVSFQAELNGEPIEFERQDATMEISELIWGLAVLGAGIFLAVYGLILFRFALLAMGFAVGMVATWWVLDDESAAMRILVAMVVGALVGLLFYSLVKFGLHIAGAMLGAVIAVIVGGLIEILGPTPGNVLWIALAAAGIVGGGVLGPRIGNLVILLATSAMGALLVVDGIRVLFESRIGGDVADISTSLTQRLTITVFAVVLVISFLSQRNASQLRRRVVN